MKFLDHLLPLDGVENADDWWRDFYQVAPTPPPPPPLIHFLRSGRGDS